MTVSTLVIVFHNTCTANLKSDLNCLIISNMQCKKKKNFQALNMSAYTTLAFQKLLFLLI